MVYKTYMKQKPDKFREVTSSFCNKPVGGLWGCRGDEWKEWCESKGFALGNLKTCFTWELKPESRVYCIKTMTDFRNLLQKYPLEVQGSVMSVNYQEVAKDYDAVEVVGSVIRKTNFKSTDNIAEMMGLSAWDVPSIVVLNLDRVVLL